MVNIRGQNAGRSYMKKIDNRFIEVVGKLKYLGRTYRNQNFIHEEITSRLKTGNSGYV
jgi:ribosomal protein L14E/L6E/L27E